MAYRDLYEARAVWNHRSDAVDESIPVCEMKVGQPGRIVQWGSCSQYIGEYVLLQRPEQLVSLTTSEFWEPVPTEDRFRVVIVPDGTLFAVDTQSVELEE